MAFKKAATAKKAAGTGMQKWDEQLAKYAEAAAATEANSSSGMKSFSTRAGVLSYDDQAMPNNEMAVVILDHVLENVFYGEAFDPDNPSPPTCFAFGRDETEMAPHATVVAHDQAQHPTCAGCPMNEWGSAEKGRGKACRNVRRLIMIPAGDIKKDGSFELIEDPDHYTSVAGAFMKLPPTSTTGYSLYVKQLRASLNRPPFAVATKVKIVPDAKSQFKVTFEALEELPGELMEALIARHEEAKQLIEQPYNLDREEEEAKPARGKPARGKPVAKAAPAKTSSRAPLARGGKKY